MVQILGWFSADAALRLALEACQGLRVLRDLVGQEFQRDKAMQPGVLGFVNHTHPAAAELFNDAVVRDGLAYHQKTCGGFRVGSYYEPGVR